MALTHIEVVTNWGSEVGHHFLGTSVVCLMKWQ